jgi:hypothetical protein
MCLFTYSLNHLRRYLLTPQSRIFVEKLTGSQLVKKFPHILYKPSVHYCIHNCPPSVLILSQIDKVHAPLLTYWKTILRLFSHYPWILHVVSLLQVSPSKHRINHYSIPYMLHAIPFLSFRFYQPKNSVWEAQPLGSALCNLLHTPVTKSL